MIRKLKTRFIALSMTALAVLLILIVAGMNLISYHALVSEADETLSILAQNEGRFPEMNKNDFFDIPGPEPPHDLSPELPFESRYFSVLLNDAGGIILTETSKIASVDTEAAIDYANQVVSRGKTQGFLKQFRFICYDDNENIRIIFLDCSRTLDNFRTFLYASLTMTLLGIVAVFFVIFFFAGKIIRPIAESYEKQKRFITDASHEIKTPLTIIGANADILEMELGENESLSDILQQTKRLKALTDDLVTLARMEEAEDAMQKIVFPLSEVVAEAAQPYHKLAAQQGKAFACHIQPLLSVNGNDGAIAKLVSILLDNAFKYSPPGGTVTLDLEQQNRTVYLSVSNNTDTPVRPESLTRIFDRFYRADESRNSETGGHGIGLSIARAVVAAHGGKIQALSPDGRTFQITVALAVA